MSRRGFLATGTAALLAPALHGCLGPDDSADQLGNPFLSARPGDPSKNATRGASALGLESGRDGVLYVPAGYSEASAAPLVVAFHGSGGDASDFEGFYDDADARGFVLLAPDSRSGTWDVVRGPFGVDVAFLDRALKHTFERTRIAPARIAFLGFSDGASFALSLGVSNGELTSHLIGFSPGFYDPASVRTGNPRIFVSHGTDDAVLPVTQSRDIIVPELRQEGYDVRYEEFQGGHEVPEAISNSAFDWFLG